MSRKMERIWAELGSLAPHNKHYAKD